MKLRSIHAELLAFALFAGLGGLVYQQITTNMVEQGIASGGPYDNAAAFPGAVAAIILVLAVLQALLSANARRNRDDDRATDPGIDLRVLVRPAVLLAIFGLYLATLSVIGYQLATPTALALMMVVCGLRKPLAILLPSLLISLGFAYLFEVWFHIVLPGGVWHLNIAW